MSRQDTLLNLDKLKEVKYYAEAIVKECNKVHSRRSLLNDPSSAYLFEKASKLMKVIEEIQVQERIH